MNKVHEAKRHLAALRTLCPAMSERLNSVLCEMIGRLTRSERAPNPLGRIPLVANVDSRHVLVDGKADAFFVGQDLEFGIFVDGQITHPRCGYARVAAIRDLGGVCEITFDSQLRTAVPAIAGCDSIFERIS